jgi:hypothetical protein
MSIYFYINMNRIDNNLFQQAEKRYYSLIQLPLSRLLLLAKISKPILYKDDVNIYINRYLLRAAGIKF